ATSRASNGSRTRFERWWPTDGRASLHPARSRRGSRGGDRERVARPHRAPRVRKRARDLGVALSMVTGSGPGGRVTREDVESLARSGVRAALYPATLSRGAPPPAWTVGSNTSSEEIPVSPIRRAVAQRLSEVAAIPQVTTFRTVEGTALDAVRRNLGVSPLPVFVRALSEVVRDHPML